MTAAEIIQALGGPAAIQRETGVPLTTVDGWKRAGRIPDWRRTMLFELAVARQLPLIAEALTSREAA